MLPKKIKTPSLGEDTSTDSESANHDKQDKSVKLEYLFNALELFLQLCSNLYTIFQTKWKKWNYEAVK